MRSDYLFYAIAAVFFLLTATALIIVADQTERSLWSVATVVIGLFALGLGYYQRPKAKTAKDITPQVQSAETGDPLAREAHVEETVEKHAAPTSTPVTASPMPTQVIAPIPAMTPPAPETARQIQTDLFTIKGIGEKRASQLKSLGVNNVEDLARASPEDIARNLSISQKITQKWIENAKECQKQ